MKLRHLNRFTALCSNLGPTFHRLDRPAREAVANPTRMGDGRLSVPLVQPDPEAKKAAAIVAVTAGGGWLLAVGCRGLGGRHRQRERQAAHLPGSQSERLVGAVGYGHRRAWGPGFTVPDGARERRGTQNLGRLPRPSCGSSPGAARQYFTPNTIPLRSSVLPSISARSAKARL